MKFKPRGEVQCAQCLKFLPRAAAVRWGRAWLHAAKCFGRALSEKRAQLDLLISGLK
jgi:hypothetical protein